MKTFLKKYNLFLSNIYYVSLRLVRKFIFSDEFLLKYGKYVPYYRINTNQLRPEVIVNEYEKYLKENKINWEGQKILEVGCGKTNSTGYEISARSGSEVFLVEPFVIFDQIADDILLEQVSKKYNLSKEAIANMVTRVKNFKEIPHKSIDIVVSSSVLEHVNTFEKLVEDLANTSKAEVKMLHIADYRDHFFKYPYHFLQFSNNVWNKFLNPGDLTRTRLSEHLKIFEKNKFKTEILHEERQEEEFEKIRQNINRCFDRNNPTLSVGRVVMLVSKK